MLSEAGIPGFNAAPQIGAVTQTPPVMTAVAQVRDLLAAAGGPLALLGGGAGDPSRADGVGVAGGGAAEGSAGATPEVAPAATTGAAETAAPDVGVARTITITELSTYSGQVGTTITITGSSFDGTALAAVNTVYFGCSNGSATCAGGVTAKPISVSRTEIKVQVPVGATTGFVQVSAPTTGKTSYSNYSSQPFTVEASVPAPTIAKLSANSGVVGQSVTIIGADFTQDATVKFGCAAKSCPGSAKGAVVTFVNPKRSKPKSPKAPWVGTFR